MMSYFTVSIVYNGKLVFIIVMSLLIAFFVAMDTHLYFTLQDMPSLLNQAPPIQGFFSPFKPLSIKLLMTDPANHYIIGPSAEYFDEITQFSKVFYFITPNMISFTHVAISFLSAKFVSSENLSTRRYGIILFEFRSWLDDLDGVVYRSHSQTKGKYQSNHKTFGYFVDIYSDLIGGVALMFGVLFYLYKVAPNGNGGKGTYSPLPLTKPSENGNVSPVPSSSPNRKFNFNILGMFSTTPERLNGLSKKYIFFKVLCFGLLMAIAGGTWDKVVEKYTDVFQTDLGDPALTQIQSEALHSGSTWLIVYLWRIWEGQALLHMVLIAVFIDRIWEFLNFFQFLGYIIIFTINLLSYVHLHQIRSELKL